MRAGYRALLATTAAALVADAISRDFSPAPGIEVVGHGGAFASPFRKRRFKANARRQRGRKLCPPFCRGRR